MSGIKCGKRAKKMNLQLVGKISQKDPQKSLNFHSFSAKKPISERSISSKGNNVTKTLKGLVTKNSSKK